MVSFDETVSYLSTLMNLYQRNEQLLINEPAIKNRASIGRRKNIVISFL